MELAECEVAKFINDKVIFENDDIVVTKAIFGNDFFNKVEFSVLTKKNANETNPKVFAKKITLK